MKTIKRGLLILSVVLSIFMIMPKSTVSAATKASGSCGTNANWTLSDDGVLTISGTGEMTSSPWKDNYKTDIKKIVISKGIKNIYKHAFSVCKNLTSIEIPNSVTSIGSCAFNDCENLTSIEIPNSVTSIGEDAFGWCKNLTSIEIPNSVTSIGSFAFFNCYGLTSIKLPNSVTSIGFGAFADCENLTSIVVDNKNSTYDSRNNCNAIIRKKDDTLIVGCKGTIIPNSVTSIGEYAFEDCENLTNIEIPNSVTSIGEMAFNGCENLTSIEIPNSVTSIGKYAFADCENLTSIVVDNKNSAYDSRNNCNAIIRKKDDTLIVGCISTIIPNSVTSIGEYAFGSCYDLTSIEIPNSVTSIGEYAFAYCYSLTSIEIPNSVTSIGKYAFFKCYSLTSIEIPNSVTSIGTWAFSDCKGLTSITFESSTLPKFGDDCFDYIKSTGIFRVPEGTSEKETNKLSGNGVTIDADHWKIEYFTPVTNVTLNKTATQLMVASSETLTATVAPANATDKSVSWSSSDTSVATVDSAGKVTAVGAGTAIITVKTTSGRKTATCIVTVEASHSWNEGKVTLEATNNDTSPVADDGTIIAGIQSISLNKENFTYTGKAIKAKVIITDANGNVLSSDNYDLKYSKSLKNVGTKSVTITFKGSYSGIKTLRYNVIPKNVSKIKVKKGSKAITVSWKKQRKQTSGYQIEYSTKKNFKNAKRITIKNTKKTKTSIKSIKAGKKYYVRIRTYKKVGSKKYYSTWSKVKTVK